ncbi:porin, partial [Mesorhizobium sp. M1A.T.Ca.IN.004.03.1.1]|uniref:porin n=1 Tax=Mesorhizobium sp. M1A.T.Ca.IN.004.03.1.1 TaxID=2496795 RepID=UPI000FD4A56D
GTIDSYVPHVVGGVKYTQGWGAISGVIAYDSNYEEVAGKLRLDVNVSDALSLFVMAGYGTDDNLSDPTWAIPGRGR